MPGSKILILLPKDYSLSSTVRDWVGQCRKWMEVYGWGSMDGETVCFWYMELYIVQSPRNSSISTKCNILLDNNNNSNCCKYVLN